MLNLRDIEQALKNFKPVSTAKADIKINPTVGRQGGPAQSGFSDLVASYHQLTQLRFELSNDDCGSRVNGKYQGSATIRYDNWWTPNNLFYVGPSRDLRRGDSSVRETGAKTARYSVPIGYSLASATAARRPQPPLPGRRRCGTGRRKRRHQRQPPD